MEPRFELPQLLIGPGATLQVKLLTPVSLAEKEKVSPTATGALEGVTVIGAAAVRVMATVA
jgi:hypothetical protein